MPSFRSGSTALHSSHGNSVVASLLHLWSLKQVEPLTLQICANQAFTWRNQPHRRAPRSPVRKTKKSGHPKLCHAPPCASVVSGKTPMRRLRFPDFQIVFVHTPPWWPCRPPICLLKKYGFQPMLHAPPRATWISGCSSTRQWTLHAPPMRRFYCWCHLTSYDDIITPRQQPRKHVHVSDTS